MFWNVKNGVRFITLITQFGMELHDVSPLIVMKLIHSGFVSECFECVCTAVFCYVIYPIYKLNTLYIIGKSVGNNKR